MIVFDEVCFSSLSTYWRIKQCVEQNKHSTITIATGDTKQLNPAQEIKHTDNVVDSSFKDNGFYQQNVQD